MVIRIDKNKKYASFEGFGASGAWWAQEVGKWDHIDSVSGIPVSDRIAQLLYSKENGIGLRTYRYNLGAGSKNSGKGTFGRDLRRAENFEIAPGKYDFSRDSAAVYMMKKAVEYGADEVVFFVNSPIERLTKNGMAHCDRHRQFLDNLSPKNYQAFAKYCLDVTEHFVAEGVPIKYLSPINEPFWKWTGGQEGCHYHPKSVGLVMKVFADEIAKRDSLNDVMLSGIESGDIRWFNKSYTRNLMKYPSVSKRIDSVDVHSYFLNPVPLPYFCRVAYLKRFRKWMDRNYPLVPVKMSEWTHMKRGRDKSIDSALVMANVMYEDISILNVTSWQHWIAVSEVDYCDGLIYINLDDMTYEMTKRYYATGNFSKYIPYGASRVDVKCDDNELKLLAFCSDDETIVIVINDTDNEKTVKIPNANTSECIIAITNEDEDLVEHRITDDDIVISAKSINTIVMR